MYLGIDGWTQFSIQKLPIKFTLCYAAFTLVHFTQKVEAFQGSTEYLYVRKRANVLHKMHQCECYFTFCRCKWPIIEQIIQPLSGLTAKQIQAPKDLIATKAQTIVLVKIYNREILKQIFPLHMHATFGQFNDKTKCLACI